MKNLLLIGCGHMGKAMYAGWAKNFAKTYRFTIINRHPVKLARKTDQYYNSLQDLPKTYKPDVIVYAVKPIDMAIALKESNPFIKSSTLLISVAAGKPMKFLANHAPNGRKFIRAMPNLPAQIGLGTTGMVASKTATTIHRDAAEKLFEPLGRIFWLKNDKQIDAFTALAGSGPGYVFMFADALIQAGKALGFSESQADDITRAMMIGSSFLLMQEKTKAADMAQAVAIKGGTTEAAFKVLRKNKALHQTVGKALGAAFTRAQVISGG